MATPMRLVAVQQRQALRLGASLTPRVNSQRVAVKVPARNITLQQVKQRIEGVTAVRGITSSMQNVAEAKMREASERAEKGSPFADAPLKLLKVIPPQENPKRVLIIAVTADRGLCGSYNNNVIRRVTPIFRPSGGGFRRKAQDAAASDVTYSLATLGNKAGEQLGYRHTAEMRFAAHDISKKGISFADCLVISEEICKLEFDQLRLYSTKFHSMMRQEITTTSVDSLPSLKDLSRWTTYDFDEETQALDNLHEFNIACLIWGALANNSVCEQASRMTSMEAATKNADEQLDELRLTFNKSRQAKVTAELSEINGGVIGMKSAKASE